MNKQQRIEAFVKLGVFLSQFSTENSEKIENPLNEKFHSPFCEVINSATRKNLWFTKTHIHNSIAGIINFLTRENLEKWLSKYKISQENTNKTVAVIMAGNIPMVGFHDMLCVLISGNSFLGKLSSKDGILLKTVSKILMEIEPEFEKLINFTDKHLSGAKDFDAIIATGSNNSARYFEAYFGKYKNIIRKNRSSVAILTGEESDKELEKLGEDVFLYFGLGCRNVSKLYLPQGFKLPKLLDRWETYSKVKNHNKYINNYDYQRSLLLMNQQEHFDNGFLLLQESKSINSPIGIIYYEFYSDFDKLEDEIRNQAQNIQCIVCNKKSTLKTVSIGKAQEPDLWDYADDVDSLEFLTQLQS